MPFWMDLGLKPEDISHEKKEMPMRRMWELGSNLVFLQSRVFQYQLKKHSIYIYIVHGYLNYQASSVGSCERLAALLKWAEEFMMSRPCTQNID